MICMSHVCYLHFDPMIFVYSIMCAAFFLSFSQFCLLIYCAPKLFFFDCPKNTNKNKMRSRKRKKDFLLVSAESLLTNLIIIGKISLFSLLTRNSKNAFQSRDYGQRVVNVKQEILHDGTEAASFEQRAVFFFASSSGPTPKKWKTNYLKSSFSEWESSKLLKIKHRFFVVVVAQFLFSKCRNGINMLNSIYITWI